MSWALGPGKGQSPGGPSLPAGKRDTLRVRATRVGVLVLSAWKLRTNILSTLVAASIPGEGRQREEGRLWMPLSLLPVLP